MAMSSTTANWHWKNKNVSGWAREWLESELPTVIAEVDDVTLGVEKVTEVEGDCELGMRKSKLITIFDLRVVLDWTATHKDGAQAKGSLTIPEVSHEVIIDGLNDYTYDWKLNQSDSKSDLPDTPSQSALSDIVKKNLPSKLSSKLETFPKTLVGKHGQDLMISPTASGSATPSANSVGAKSSPVPAKAVADAVAGTSTKTASAAKGVFVNSSTVRVEAQFMVSADDLFGFLTDETRIPQWTRAPAQSNPVQDAPFSLFGGGVVGKFVSVDRPNGFVQTWKLKSPTWPEDHEGTLRTTIDQGTDSSKLVLELSGVPKGQEDDLEKNLTGYYINSLKSIGCVPFSVSSSSYRTPASLYHSRNGDSGSVGISQGRLPSASPASLPAKALSYSAFVFALAAVVLAAWTYML